MADELILAAGDFTQPLTEAAASATVVPERGRAVREDGTVRVAVIRPCVSRGKKIAGPDGRSYPPRYRPEMLESSAKVFTGWPMYIDHAIAEALAEALKEALGETISPEQARRAVQRLQERRKLQELGGRVVKTWYDRDLALKEDRENGYRKGGVVGDVIPYQWAKGILEVDPIGLGVSINAWPTGARLAEEEKTRVMDIAGISPTPVGSLDWVWKGGAGGRPLTEAETLAVSLAEALYDPPQNEMAKLELDLTNLSPAGLLEALKKESPELAESFEVRATKPSGGAPTPPATPPPSDGKLQESVNGLMEKVDQLSTKLQQAQDPTKLQELVDDRAEEMRTVERLERHAHSLIESAEGIPDSFKTELKGRYAYLPGSGPSPALLVEAETDDQGNETKSLQKVLEARVDKDLDHVRNLIADAQGKPRVRKQGGPGGGESVEEERKEQEKAVESGAFADWLRESGDLPDDGKVQDFITGVSG